MLWRILITAGAAVLLEPALTFAGESASRYNVVEHEAVGDGTALNSAAIQSAIDACAKDGGGTVIIPAGRFLTGPIRLRSHVALHLEPGAILEGSSNFADYRVDGRRRGLIEAADAEHLAITGLGVIRGNGSAFMLGQIKPLENTTGRYSRQGASYDVGSADGPRAMGKRPGSLIGLANCRSVVLRDITIEDAPEWTIRLAECDGAIVSGVTILNNPLIPNNDGIHCVTCRNVRISDCDVRAGDDAIAVTGLYGKPGAVAENITVTNCTLQSRSAGVRVGYGSNSIRRCAFSNLVIHDSNRGAGVFVRDEGSVSDLLFSNIIIHTRLHTGDWWGRGEPIHISRLPQKAGTSLGRVENVRFSHIMADSEHGIVVWGDEPGGIAHVSMDAVHLKITPSPLNERFGGNFDLRPARDDRYSLFEHDVAGLYARNVEGLKLLDFELEWAAALPSFFSDGIHCEDVRGIELDGFVGRQAGDTGAAVRLSRCRNLAIRNCRSLAGTDTFLVHSNLAGTALLAGNDLARARQAFLPGTSGLSLCGNLLPNAAAKEQNATATRPE